MRIFIFLSASFFINASFACSCLNVSLEEKVSSSDFIYFGKITSSNLVSESKVLNTLELIEVLKGQPNTLELLSSPMEHMCSMPSGVGTTYIVYGKYDKQPTLSLCGFTQPHVKSLIPDFEEELVKIKSTAKKSLEQDK
jgi:hypothetical protein